MPSFHCVFSLLLISSFALSLADLDHHHYEEGEKVLLWVNRVGPYRNPQEVYAYYSLPFCQPDQYIESTHETLGEALLSYDLILSPLSLHFKENMTEERLCTRTLSEKDAALFHFAIVNDYWFQLFVDDLPMWGMVGERVEDIPRIFTRKNLFLTYNGNQIITVNLTMSHARAFSPGDDVTFTYSVTWAQTNISFHDRFNVYLDSPFFEHQIHWFSILNSFMMLTFLIGLVGVILVRTLRKDYARFERAAGEEDDPEQSGWKQIHGDVFRSPDNLEIFSALVGVGHQLFFLTLFLLALSFWGTFYVETRGAISTAVIFSYSLTSFIAGYTSGGYYSRNEGVYWIRTLLMTSSILPFFCFGVAFVMNAIAFSYQSASKIEIASLTILFLIWLLLAFPLTILGTILGRNWNGKADIPCKISKSPRPIPPRPWYLQSWVHILAGGALPFGSIFIEMFFIFSSFWHYKYYYVYGFLFLVFVILICVTICVSIVSTYFLLNAEDHRWKWTSFLSSASTALYVFLYAWYYFHTKTKMSGFFQVTFYFLYVSLFCVALGILCGTIGFVGSSVFVKRIYRNIKME